VKRVLVTHAENSDVPSGPVAVAVTARPTAPAKPKLGLKSAKPSELVPTSIRPW